jgi:hypothetical protein
MFRPYEAISRQLLLVRNQRLNKKCDFNDIFWILNVIISDILKYKTCVALQMEASG